MKTIRIIFLTTIMSLTDLGLGEASDRNDYFLVDSDEQCLDLSLAYSLNSYGTSLSAGGWVYQASQWIAWPWWYRVYYLEGYCDVKNGKVTCYPYGGGW